MVCCVYCGARIVDKKNMCCTSCGRAVPIYLKRPLDSVHMKRKIKH